MQRFKAIRIFLAIYGCICVVYMLKIITVDTYFLAYLLYKSPLLAFPPAHESLTLYVLCMCCLGFALLINIIFFWGLSFILGDLLTSHGFIYTFKHLNKSCYLLFIDVGLCLINFINNEARSKLIV